MWCLGGFSQVPGAAGVSMPLCEVGAYPDPGIHRDRDGDARVPDLMADRDHLVSVDDHPSFA